MSRVPPPGLPRPADGDRGGGVGVGAMTQLDLFRGDLVVAFSGGKDSTALALQLAERGHAFRLLYTPTGNELPAVNEHIARVAAHIGMELVIPEGPNLRDSILDQRCIPNFRMRWCTRMIKIEPCARWLQGHPGITLAVGLRADEDGRAGGTYDAADITYPLRDWCWDEGMVIDYCKAQGFEPPERTDCAWCYHQTLSEWWSLWSTNPMLFEQGESLELYLGHTFRSEDRDTWPASMRGLRREFEQGRKPKPRRRRSSCRVCSL